MTDRSGRTATPARGGAVWQWWAMAVLAVASLALGYLGFWKYFAGRGTPASVWHTLYVTAQLFTLESGPVPGPVPWQLNAARFLAPVVPAWAAVRALLFLFRDQLLSLRIGLLRGHVVVCGLGRKGLHIVEDFREHGERVLAIERDPDADGVRACLGSGVPVVIGDAADLDVLRKVRADRAKRVVAVTGDDGANVEIAVLTYRLAREHKKPPDHVVWCHAQVVDLRLSTLFERHRILTETSDRFAVSIFNPYRSSARLALAEHPLDYERIGEDDRRQVHLVIVGLGQMGESVAMQAAEIGSYANGRKLRLSVIDRVASSLEARFVARHPQIDEVCKIEFFEHDVEDPEATDLIRSWVDDPSSLTTIAICLDGDPQGLSAALGILSEVEDGKTPILVRMSDEVGLATLLECEGEQSGWVARVHPFGIVSRVCSREELLRERLDKVARALHEQFVQKRKADGRPETDPSMQPWESLDESLKNSNRRAADHIAVKLRAVGCYATSEEREGEPVTSFDDRDVEAMSKMEHDRWCAERRLAGWTPGEKDHERRTTPHLVDWKDLAEEYREYDREFVREIPNVLASVGERIYRSD